jgi:CubicO group peptidase (beta-lactamase class C family)
MLRFQKNINGKIEGDKNLIFDIASITKVFTTLLICRAIESKKLKLSDVVSKFLLNFTKSPLTIYDLLTHKADFGVSMTDLRSKFTDLKVGVSSMEIENCVNLESNYQNLTFLYLGNILEIIYKKSIGDIFREFFVELDLKETYCGDRLLGCNLEFAPTEVVNGELTIRQTHDESARAWGGIAGNAGIFSTVKDLGILAKNILDFKILSEKFIKKQLLTNQNNDITPRSLGFWLYIPGVTTDKLLISHTGYTGGLFVLDFKNKKYAILLTNRTIIGRDYQDHKLEWQKLVDLL